MKNSTEILARYGRHDRECVLCHDANLPGDPRCTCGFSAAQVQAQHNAQPKLLAALEKIAVGTSPASVSLQLSNAVALCAELHSIAQAALANPAGKDAPENEHERIDRIARAAERGGK